MGTVQGSAKCPSYPGAGLPSARRVWARPAQLVLGSCTSFHPSHNPHPLHDYSSTHCNTAADSVRHVTGPAPQVPASRQRLTAAGRALSPCSPSQRASKHGVGFRRHQGQVPACWLHVEAPHEGVRGGADFRSRHCTCTCKSRAFLSTRSEKWQRRLFMAKDGFLLYYDPKKSPEDPHFDNKPKVRRRARCVQPSPRRPSQRLPKQCTHLCWAAPAGCHSPGWLFSGTHRAWAQGVWHARVEGDAP